MNGKFIVIEGLDGSGKSTQMEMLQSWLKENAIEFQSVHFPRLNEGTYGTLIGEFLRGDFGKLEDVHPKLVALLYAGDRLAFSSTIREWIDAGKLVIADRYVYSNIAFQCAKLSDVGDKRRLKDWIIDLEYHENKIPQPDFSLFLNVPTHATAKALSDDAQRGQREYLVGNVDIHEADLSFQSRVHNEYIALTRNEERFETIECVDQDGRRLTAEHTHRAILRKLQDMRIVEAS